MTPFEQAIIDTAREWHRAVGNCGGQKTKELETAMRQLCNALGADHIERSMKEPIRKPAPRLSIVKGDEIDRLTK